MKALFILLFCSIVVFANTIEYYEDKSLSYSSKNISSNKEFSTYSKEKSNFGMTRSIYWLKLVFENKLSQPSKKIVNFSFPLLDKITLYKEEQNILKKLQVIGNLVQKSEDELIEPKLSLHLGLDANRSTTYYISVKSAAPMNLDMNFYSPKEFANYKVIWLSSIAFYVGAVLIILLYNLILYLFIRVRAYLYYVLFHSSFLFLILALDGALAQFVYPQYPELSMFIIPLAITVTAGLQILFVYEFLEIKKHGKISKKLMLSSMGYAVFIFIFIMFSPYQESILLANTVSLIGLIIPLAIAVYYWVRLKSISAKFYVIAWFLITLGVIVEHLKNSGLIESNLFTINAMQVGIIIELLMISLALAYRFNQLRDQNKELNTLAITDSMTKIKNRRYFLERMEVLIKLLKRRSEEHTLIMLDIDYFKSVNDNFGHAIGDKVLVEFSRKVTSTLREEDLFARIGGEEFIILARANKEEVLGLTTRIRTEIESMQVSSDKGSVKFTVSMGVTFFNDASKRVDELLHEADEALYKAKENGRNRVEFFITEN